MNLAHLVDSHPDGAPALIDEAGEVTTYGDLRREAGRLRARLAAAGVGPDDRVALVAANDPAFVAGYLAILGVGAVAVPLNPTSPAAELGGELARVRVGAVVTGPGAEQAGAGLDRSGLGGVPVLAATNGRTGRHVHAPDGETTDGAPVRTRRPRSSTASPTTSPCCCSPPGPAARPGRPC